MKTSHLFLIALLLASLTALQAQVADVPKPAIPVLPTPDKTNQWSPEKARDWYQKQPWMVGCDYIPATAINQVEMFQPGTYDPVTIRRELAMAKGLGFNTLRMFLHDILWKEEVREGFLKNFDDFLGICESNGMRCIVVLFDDCWWDYDIKLGAQHPRIAGMHNNGWLKSPGRKLVTAYADKTISAEDKAWLKGYIQGVMKRYANDKRIVMWDVYNEPGDCGATSVLLADAWKWAREINPSQPLTGCTFGCSRPECSKINGANSDVVSYHCYVNDHKNKIASLKAQYAQRPVVCTEYLLRPANGSTFQRDLPVLKESRVGAINWGFVNGKTGCVYGWETTTKFKKFMDDPGHTFVQAVQQLQLQFDCPKPGENYPGPRVWFHEIFRMDGTPFDQKEVDFIKEMTGAK